MNRTMIEKTETFLKEKFDGAAYLNAHPDAKAYRLEHTYRVANLGRQIAQREGFDETELVIACLLHDVSYCEDFGENGWIEHGRHAARIARPFLRELGLPEERIADICYGIAIHVDDKADFPGERTPFALSVGDADNLDRFDAYRIHETLFHDGFLELPYEEKLALTEKRLARLRELRTMEMGTRAAKEIWEERIGFYISFYERLLAQLRSSKRVEEGDKPVHEVITLQPMTAEMYHAYYKEYQNDPDLYTDKSKFTPYRYVPEGIDRYIQRQRDLHRLCFAIMLGEDIAGEIILKNIEPRKCATLSISMKNAAYKDRGIGTQAERLAVEYVFRELDIPILYADTLLTNTRSQHVLEKVGFRYLRTEGEFKYYCIERT